MLLEISILFLLPFAFVKGTIINYRNDYSEEAIQISTDREQNGANDNEYQGINIKDLEPYDPSNQPKPQLTSKVDSTTAASTTTAPTTPQATSVHQSTNTKVDETTTTQITKTKEAPRNEKYFNAVVFGVLIGIASAFGIFIVCVSGILLWHFRFRRRQPYTLVPNSNHSFVV